MLIELSHPIRAGMRTYPGLPEPQIETVLDYEASRRRYQGQAEFRMVLFHLHGNTGTYVDSPRHRFASGADLAGLPLERLAHLPAVRVDAPGARGIGPEVFAGVELSGRAALVHTGWSRHWGTEAYFTGHPFLTRAAGEHLVRAGVRFVGIDTLNIDDTADPARPVHTGLLGAGIPICEHMTNLEAVPATGAFLHAVPLAFEGGTTLPVRAYVVVEG